MNLFLRTTLWLGGRHLLPALELTGAPMPM